MGKARQIEFIICAACGAFCALCFDLPALSFFAWVAPAPMFCVLLKNKGSVPRVLARAAVFALSLCLVYYVQLLGLDVTARVGAASGWMLALAWLGVSALHGAVFTAALAAGVCLKCPAALRAPLMAAVYTGAEWLIGAGVLGLPCIRLGLTQWTNLPATQSAALFGALFISWLMVLVSMLLAQAVCSKGRKRAWAACAAALVFFANLAGGAAALNGGKLPQADVSIAAVQTNAPFWKDEGQGRFEKALALAGDVAHKKPDFIILPENSVYGSFADDAALSAPVAQLARSSEGYVLTGVYGIHGYMLRNSVFLTAPDGSVADVYNKQRLVPFFENGYERPFSLEDGKNRGVFETEYGNLGVMICFESLFSDIAVDTAAQGAQLLVVATNDSWFTNEIPLSRHLAQSVLRAQETGKYLVQAANTGATAAVAPTGEVLARLEANTDGVLVAKVGFLQEITPYMALCDWWLIAAVAIPAAAVFYAYKKRV